MKSTRYIYTYTYLSTGTFMLVVVVFHVTVVVIWIGQFKEFVGRRGWNFVDTLIIACPRSSYPIYIASNLLYKMGSYFLDMTVLLQVRTWYSNIFNISFCKLSCTEVRLDTGKRTLELHCMVWQVAITRQFTLDTHLFTLSYTMCS